MTSPWPLNITLAPTKDHLTIRFDDGFTASLTAELLRVSSPSAEVQGHGSGQKQTPAGKRDVRITNVEAVGQYAVRLTFSDGHDTGIFSWEILYNYGQERDQIFEDYLKSLEDLGLSRG